MDTKALRQKILDLAIRGKLVPQDPNDEPASVLLERIRAEKERLIAEGKIKRPKKSKASSSESHYQHFEIPNSWEWTTLGEIFSMQAGKNIQASKLKEYSDEAPYPCYGGNGIRGYLPKYNHEGLYPIVGRQGALCGNINMASGKFYATEHAVVVDYFSNTEPLLCRYFLEVLNLNQYATATAQPGLSVAKIEEVPIPLPPIQEQTRIIKAVESWFERITLLEKNTLTLTECISTIKSKILELAMQGKLVPQDPADEPAADMLRRINPKAKILTDIPHYYPIPNTWIFGNLSSVTSIKSAKRIMKSDWSESGVPFYRTREIVKLSRDGYVNNELFISHELYKELKEKYGVPSEADIMLTAVGTIGATYIVKHNDLFYYKDASVLCIHPSIALYSKYLSILFSCSLVQKQMKNNSKGTTVDTITIEKAGNYIFPLPPLNEQKRIVAKIEELFQVLDSIEASLQS